MKRLGLAAALTAVCFLIGIYGSFSTEKRVGEITGELMSAAEALKAGDVMDTTKRLQNAAEKWERHRLYFSVMTNREMLCELSADIPSLPPLSQSADKSTTLEKIEKALHSLEAVSDSQKVSFSNIL